MPCLLRPICSSAISVAAIARNSLRCVLQRALAMVDARRARASTCVYNTWVSACARACMCVCGCVCACVHTRAELSWLNSRSAGTNYNEPRLVGRESAMFSFLCPVVYRPFYRGHPLPLVSLLFLSLPPSSLPSRTPCSLVPLAVLERDLLSTAPLAPSSPSPESQRRYLATRPSSTPPLPRDLLTMRNPPGGGKKISAF